MTPPPVAFRLDGPLAAMWVRLSGSDEVLPPLVTVDALPTYWRLAKLTVLSAWMVMT